MFGAPIEWSTLLAIAIGFLLDSIIGEPQNPAHPVRLIGWVIGRLVALYKKLALKNKAVQFFYGMVMAIFCVSLTFFVGFWIVWGGYALHVAVGVAVEAILCYFVLAARGLYDEGMKIYHALSQKDIAGARHALSYIVGRDTDCLEEEKIVKATVETIAENLSDGVIAPLIFLLIGGAPLGLLYKAVNTLDSMVGYRNETFAFVGKFSARLDDLLNLIPARLSAFLMMAAAFLTGNSGRGAARMWWRDRYKHLSPNSAHTEAACAGALGISLGGASYYKGKLVEKPTIGDAVRAAQPEDIRKTGKMMYVSGILALLFGGIVILLLWRWFGV